MVFSFRWSKCLFAFIGVLCTCLVLEGVTSASANKQAKVHSNVYVYPQPTNASHFSRQEQPLYQRHRRKLPNESTDHQQNALDDSGLQFQEYQGVFGRPGVDFPVLSHIPVTKFNCRNVKNSNTGYYADLDTHCQVFHVCDGGRKVSFLCPNGTIFRQSHLICDWWFRVECERSPELYDQSVQQLEADQHLYKQRAETISNAMQNALSKGVTDSVMLDSPVSVTNKLNQGFNSESNLPRELHSIAPVAQNHPTTTGFTPSNNQFTSPVNSFQFNNNNNPSTVSQTSNFIPASSTGGFDFQRFTSGSTTPAKSSFNQAENSQFNNFPANFDQFDYFASTPSPSFQYSTINSNAAANGNGFQNANPLQNANFASTPSPQFSTFNSNAPPNRNNFQNENPSENANTTPATSNNIATANQRQKQLTTTSWSTAPSRTTNYTPPRATSAQASSPQLNNLNSVDSVSPSKNFNQPKAPFNQNYNPSSSFPTTPQRSTVSATLPPKPSPLRTTPRGSIFPASNSLRTDFSSQFPKTRGQQTLTPAYTPPVASTPPNLASNYFQENQILSETAAFAGKNKYSSLQNYYHPQNFLNQANAKLPVTPAPSVDNTPYNELTTFSLYDSLFDTAFGNATNETFALYYPSDTDAIDLLNQVTIQPNADFAPATNTSKPSVSEFLFNSLSTNPTAADVTQPDSETIPILLTNQTQQGYNQLFTKDDRETASTVSSDLQTEHSRGLVQSSSPRTLPSAESLNEKLKFKSSPDFRELAQIFSRALSAYLEDPEQFRQILSEVRPTEPPGVTSSKSEPAADEVLAFSEDERTTPRATTNSQTIRDPETFAEEINNFMFDPFAQQGHTDSGEFNVNDTYYPTSFTTNTTPPITFTVSPLIDHTRTHAPLATMSASTPPKVNLYDDRDPNSNAPQTLQEEPLLLTADTQSFIAPENLVRYQNYAQYNIQLPILKTPGYPQFGMRTTPAFITSRADSTTRPPPSTDAYRTSTADEQFLRTTLNVISPETLKPLFNESAVHAMMNMMKEAKTNPGLRNKLVLLLVNDRSGSAFPETNSVRDVKSKLLRALLVPAPTTAAAVTYAGVTEYPISRRKVRKESSRVSSHRPLMSTTPAVYRAVTDMSKSTSNVISRSERSTSRPQQVEANRLDDTDSRAVDLLKTLYSLASNNWTR